MARKTVPIYLRKMGTDAYGNAFPTYNVEEKFGFTTEDMPLILTAAVKDLSKNDFYDEDGEQEWAQRRLRLKSYEIKLNFISEGTKKDLYLRFKLFRDYLLGVDGTGTVLMYYEDWYGQGRKDVRLKEIDDNVNYVQAAEDDFIMEITIILKVNDPITEVRIDSDGELQAEDLDSGLIINGEELVSADNVRIEETSLIIL